MPKRCHVGLTFSAPFLQQRNFRWWEMTHSIQFWPPSQVTQWGKTLGGRQASRLEDLWHTSHSNDDQKHICQSNLTLARKLHTISAGRGGALLLCNDYQDFYQCKEPCLQKDLCAGFHLATAVDNAFILVSIPQDSEHFHTATS